jgi:predicted O-methyltransferase YrrM
MQVTFNMSGHVISLPDNVVDLAKKFSSNMMDEHELLALAAACTLAPANEYTIAVEIGTYLGNTAVFLAKVLRELGRYMPVLSIDAFHRVQSDPLNPQGILSEYLHNIRENGVEDVCMPLLALSADAARVVPAAIGLLIIDGGHSYEVARADLELYTPKIQQGGIFFMDDYGSAYPDVVRAVDRFFLSPSCRFRILHQSYFIIAGPAD